MQRNLFKTCSGTKEHICDEQLQGGILRNDFMFASLPRFSKLLPHQQSQSFKLVLSFVTVLPKPLLP